MARYETPLTLLSLHEYFTDCECRHLPFTYEDFAREPCEGWVLVPEVCMCRTVNKLGVLLKTKVMDHRHDQGVFVDLDQTKKKKTIAIHVVDDSHPTPPAPAADNTDRYIVNTISNWGRVDYLKTCIPESIVRPYWRIVADNPLICVDSSSPAIRMFDRKLAIHARRWKSKFCEKPLGELPPKPSATPPPIPSV